MSKHLLPRLVSGIIGLIVFAVVWFGIAGRVTWWQGWAFLLTFVTYVGMLSFRLARVNPELMQERNRPSGSAEAWDRVLMGIYTLFLIVELVVASIPCSRLGGRSITGPSQPLRQHSSHGSRPARNDSIRNSRLSESRPLRA